MNLQLSNLAIHQLVKELAFLENGFVNNVQTIQNNWIKMKIHTKDFGDKQLILTPNSFFVSTKSIQAKQSPGGFSAFLKKFVYNQRIISLKQHDFDRVLEMIFPNNILIIELFAKGNLILCDKDYKIIRAFRKEEWKDRKLEKEELYKFPSSKGANILTETEKIFLEKMSINEKSFFGAVLETLNIPPQILDFIFEKEKLNKLQNAKETSKKELLLVFNKLKEIYSNSFYKAYLTEDIIFTIDLNKQGIEFESINTALNKTLLEQLEEETKKENKTKLKEEKGLKNLKIRETQIEQMLKEGEENQKKGEKIYLHYTKLNEIITAIKIGESKKLSENEIKQKINSTKPNPSIKTIDLKKKKLIFNFE